MSSPMKPPLILRTPRWRSPSNSRKPISLKYAVTTNLLHPNMTTTLGKSTCSANIAPSDAGAILWFDPRREHSSVPTAKSRSRHAQGLGLDWPEHGGMLIGSGLQALATSGKFKPVALGQIRTAGNRGIYRG